MRWGCVVVLLCVAGCESRYGAYLSIDGEIEFDTVELYFGKAIDSSGPGSGDQFATPKLGAQSGLIFDRRFTHFDRFSIEPTTGATFYLPPDDANLVLGAYVVAVVLRDQQPVGITEYFGFEVPTREVHEYELPVVTYDPVNVERWGGEPGCIAWKRPREGVEPLVAVVRKDDRDCDDMLTTADCNDLCATGSTACSVSMSLCTSPCALGCAANDTCTPQVCMPTNTCNSTCLQLSSLDSRLRCGLQMSPEHVEVFVDTLSGRMCAHEYVFALPKDLATSTSPPCATPNIEFVDVPAGAGFVYAIAQEQMSGGCLLSVTQSTQVAFDSLHHLVVSFAAADPGKPRRSVIVGVQSSGQQACTVEGYTTTNLGPIFDCLP